MIQFWNSFEKQSQKKRNAITAGSIGALIGGGALAGKELYRHSNVKRTMEMFGDKAPPISKKLVGQKAAKGAIAIGLPVAGLAYLLSKKDKQGIKKSAKQKEPGWFAKQKGLQKATRSSDKGLGKYITDPELSKKMRSGGTKGFLRGIPYGSLAGAGAGAIYSIAKKSPYKGTIIPMSSILGGLEGGAIGQMIGQNRAMKEHLKGKGIESKYLGLKLKFSPEAKKKYIDAYKK